MGESWVGGDIAGLQAMGDTMKPAPDEIRSIVSALSSQADTLVSDAGWSGAAADEFRKAWSTNAIQAGGLADVVAQVGQTIGDLGDQLAKVEADLYNAADAAKGRGAVIGADGRPGTLVVSGDPADPAAAAALEAQSDYTAAYDYAKQLAQGFRLHAADSLSAISDAVEPRGDAVKWDQRVTIADYLKGLWVIPNEKARHLGQAIPQQIDDAEDRLRDARSDMEAERSAYDAKGLKLPGDNPSRLAHSAAVRDLVGLQTTLEAAEAAKSEPVSRVLNAKLGDVEKLIPELKSAMPAGLDFLKDIPAIDVVASGVAAEFQSQDDIEKGWSPSEAREKDYAAAGIGLVGGGVVAAAIAGTSAPVWAPVVGGGLAVVGIGDYAYQGFHEHWSEDIHDNGVFGGLEVAQENIVKNTGNDIEEMAGGLWHGVGSLWD